MDVAKAFTYITEDDRWMGKIGMGIIVSLASVLVLPAFLLSGYMIGITRNVMNGEKRPLPEWEDLGTLFKDGISIFVVSLVYTLPFWLLTCIVFVSTIGFGGLSEATEMNEEAIAAGIFVTWGIVGCLFMIFLVAFFFISPAIVIQYVRQDDLAACFRFGEIIAIIRDNMGDIIIAGLTPMAASLVFSMVMGAIGMIPCVGLISIPIGFAFGPILSAVSGHLYGQIAGKTGGTPPEEKFAI